MTKLPTLQRRIARYLAVTERWGYDVQSIEIVDIVVDYLNEQSYKKNRN